MSMYYIITCICTRANEHVFIKNLQRLWNASEYSFDHSENMSSQVAFDNDCVYSKKRPTQLLKLPQVLTWHLSILQYIMV